MYERFFSKKADVEHFRLPGTLEYAAKLADTFYTSSEEYMLGRSRKNVDVPPLNFEVEGLLKLAQEPSFTSRISADRVSRDERSSSIEVHSHAEIDIRDATLAIILPQQYLQLDEIVEALSRWNLPADAKHYYKVIGFHVGESWMGQIYREIEKVYRKHGIIEDSATCGR
jgi:hypothetical protein